MFRQAHNKSNLRVQDPKIHNIQRKIYFSSKMCTDLRRFWSIFVFFLIDAKEVEMCPLNKNKQKFEANKYTYQKEVCCGYPVEFRTLEFFEQDYCIRLVINLFQQSESDILDLTIKSLYGQY